MADKIVNGSLKSITVSAEVTCGSAVVHFPGNSGQSLGLGYVNLSNKVPSGGTFVALIPRQASRASGVDVAYVIVPDNSPETIRIYGTPNQTYTVSATLLYY